MEKGAMGLEDHGDLAACRSFSFWILISRGPFWNPQKSAVCALVP